MQKINILSLCQGSFRFNFRQFSAQDDRRGGHGGRHQRQRGHGRYEQVVCLLHCQFPFVIHPLLAGKTEI